MNQLVQHLLSSATTIEEAQDVWRANRNELRGCTFVLATSQTSPFHFPARTNLPGGGLLRSVFASNYLHFLSDDLLVNQQVCRGTREITASYSVSFDSNTASYLRSIALGRSNDDVKATISFLGTVFGGVRFRWDYFPYLLERADDLLEGHDLNFIFETVLGCELLAACDAAELSKNGSLAVSVDEKEIERRAKSQIDSWKMGLGTGLIQEIRHRLNIFYIFVLKSVSIQLKRPKQKDAPAKLEELLEFLGDSLGCIPQLTASSALQFFTKGPAFRPFQKLASRNPDLKKKAMNVAWDILHLQFGHEFTGFHGTNGAFLVRYFLTFDRPLAELFDTFPQRSCLICPGRRFPLFFADFDFPSQVLAQFPELGPVIAKHFKLGADEERSKRVQASPVDVHAIIAELELEVDKLVGQDTF